MSLKSPWEDSNYFIFELMTLITDQYQDTDIPIRVSCNVMINLKWDELITIVLMVRKLIEYLINQKKVIVIRRHFDAG